MEQDTDGLWYETDNDGHIIGNSFKTASALEAYLLLSALIRRLQEQEDPTDE
jgi:hypothetical protein